MESSIFFSYILDGCDVATAITDEGNDQTSYLRIYFCITHHFTFLEQECWNIAKLDSILATLAEETGETYAGVNSAYVYFGMWKATFSWHVEDMDVSGRFHRMFNDFFLHLIKSI